MSKYNFGPACEEYVYGAQRPGYRSAYVSQDEVLEWISFMKADHQIKSVCCLLSIDELQEYYHFSPGLIATYKEAFGDDDKVCHVEIIDGALCDPGLLMNRILPFLAKSMRAQEKVVVHCSAGMGRTGHVLAAWLAYSRGYAPEKAIAAVRHVEGVIRYPSESGREAELKELLEAAREAGRYFREEMKTP